MTRLKSEGAQQRDALAQMAALTEGLAQDKGSLTCQVLQVRWGPRWLWNSVPALVSEPRTLAPPPPTFSIPRAECRFGGKGPTEGQGA